MKYPSLAILIMLSFHSYAQDDQLLSQEEQYAYNIQQEYINDVYIPENIPDALAQLDELSDEAGRTKLLEADEQLAADRLVMGLGKWMIVNWNFYEGSRLSHVLKQYGVTHPDDMAKFLIVTYHRHLRKAPLELEERGKVFFGKRKSDQEKRNAEKKVIETPKR